MALRILSDKEKGLFQLPARTVDDLLADMLRARKRWLEGDEVAVPRASFHLRSGRDLTGWVIDLQNDGHGRRTVLLHRADGGGPAPWDACYLDATTIEAITVHDAPAAAHLISEGKVAGTLPPPPDGTPPPTRLEIKRMMADRAKLVSAALGTELVFDVSWDRAPEAGEPLRVLHSLIADTADSLREIAGDELGKQALQKIRKVWFGEGGKAVLREGETLVVVARYAFGAEGRLAKAELRSAIEKAL